MQKRLLFIIGALFAGAQYMKLKQPKGVRNNNPLNIKEDKRNNWSGSVGSAGGFVQFITPVYGIRAAAKLLRNYRDMYGINTIEGVIKKWAPKIENNTAAYIKSVSQKTNIEPDAVLSDSGYLAVIEAMIYHENGQQPYNDTTIQTGFSMGFYES